MATAAAKPSALARARLVLANPKTGYMTLFGFGSGLPYALLLGTLTAWLTDAKVDLETMGVISLIGLAYAFKFLWSPLLDRLSLPGLAKLGASSGSSPRSSSSASCCWRWRKWTR